LRPVAIQSDEGQALLAGVAEDARLRSAHAVDAHGRVYSGGDAIPVVAAALPAGAPAAWVARLMPALTRVGYRMVAGNRTRFGRLVNDRMRAGADVLIARRQRE
jgi:predicted DCC family thiol-disulfide oxidoreductase YuxK